MTPKYDVTAFGEILIDFTPCGTNEQGAVLYAQNPGGAPGNVCVGVSRLGGRAAFLGKVGDDVHGRFLKHVLEQEHVQSGGLLMDLDHFTTLAFVQVKENGERDFSFARKPGADTCMRGDELRLDIISDSRFFHVGSLSMTHEPSRSATLKGLQHAIRSGVLVSYDPNYRYSLWNSEREAVACMRSLIPYADVMKLSAEETVLLTGFADARVALQALMRQGVRLAAVTLGKDGAMACNRHGLVAVEGISSVVADTNGAGDSFWAAMLFRLCRDGRNPEDVDLESLRSHLEFANAAAALTVSRAGAIPAMPDLEQVESFLGQ